MNRELPHGQAGFRKGRGTTDQIVNICWIIEKAREFQKNICFCFIDYAKALTVWITTSYRKFLKRWEQQTTLPASWEICMKVKNQQLEPDMEKQTGCKLGKEYVHPAYLTYMQSTSCKMPAILENSAATTRLENVCFIQIPKKGNAKECSKYWTIEIISK